MAQFLGDIGTRAGPPGPALRNLLVSQDVKVAFAGYNAFARVSGPRPLTDVEACAMLHDLDHSALPQTWAAFKDLKDLCNEITGVSSLPAGLALHRKETYFRRAAIETLAAISPQKDSDAIQALVRAARGDDPALAMRPEIAPGRFLAQDGPK